MPEAPIGLQDTHERHDSHQRPVRTQLPSRAAAMEGERAHLGRIAGRVDLLIPDGDDLACLTQ